MVYPDTDLFLASSGSTAGIGIHPFQGVSSVVLMGAVLWRPFLHWSRDLGLFRSLHEDCLCELCVFQETGLANSDVNFQEELE